MKTKKIHNNVMQNLLLLAVIAVMYVFFSIFGNNFLSGGTVVNILDSCYYIGFMAIGTTFVIITGGIDLSLGTAAICGGLIGGSLYNQHGWSIAAALIMVIVVCALFGVINGILVAYLNLPPFIATLGTQMITTGLGAIFTNVNTQRFPVMGTEDGWYKYVFYKSPTGFPMGLIWLAIFFVIAYILLNKTKVGRYTFAIGSNREAIRLSGVNVKKYQMIVYIICGFYVGLAGVMYAATYTSVIPTEGSGLEMDAIAAAIIGGTSMSGGVGTLPGTIIGVFVMSVLKQGLMCMGLQGHWQTFFTGFIVIFAVLLDVYRSKGANKIKNQNK